MLAFSIIGFACLCTQMPKNAKEALKKSQAVFSGKIIAFEQEGINAIYTFQVERIWKGETHSELRVVDMTFKSSCDIGLRSGQRYVVFASSQFFSTDFPEGKYISPDKDGKPRLVADACSWTVNLADIERSKKVISKIGKGKPAN